MYFRMNEGNPSSKRPRENDEFEEHNFSQKKKLKCLPRNNSPKTLLEQLTHENICRSAASLNNKTEISSLQAQLINERNINRKLEKNLREILNKSQNSVDIEKLKIENNKLQKLVESLQKEKENILIANNSGKKDTGDGSVIQVINEHKLKDLSISQSCSVDFVEEYVIFKYNNGCKVEEKILGIDDKIDNFTLDFRREINTAFNSFRTSNGIRDNKDLGRLSLTMNSVFIGPQIEYFSPF
uniref:Uncharacterized protein n=1 Tax=Parastrongyloides trichosuri TaxID=131310 RepID=A0A0N4ZU56_PARTI